MTSKLFLELAFVGLMFGTLVVVSKRRIAEATSTLDALRRWRDALVVDVASV